MNMHMFLRIPSTPTKHDIYFRDKLDGLNQEAITAIRILSHGVYGVFQDEYLQIGEATAMESLEHFCDALDMQELSNRLGWLVQGSYDFPSNYFGSSY